MTALTPHWLDHIHSGDRLWVGDKALQLALALQQGYPVLPGFVIPSIALSSILQYTLWPYPLLVELADSSTQFDVYDPQQLQVMARHLRDILNQTSIPDDLISTVLDACRPWNQQAVILRPSVAIEREPVPDVHGLLDARVCAVHPRAIAQSLQQLWGEIFRARSLIFWHRLDISLHHVHLAVLVQPIDNAIASGTMRVQGTQVEIKATLGLRQSITNGDVIPDDYRIDLQQYPMQEMQLGVKPYQARLVYPDTGQSCEPVPDAAKNEDADSPLVAVQEVNTTPSQQNQPALQPSQVQDLVELAQRFQTEFSDPVEVDWFIPASMAQLTDPASPLQIVRLMPSPHRASARAPQTILNQPEATIADVLYGLAASPGQAIASAWIVTDLPEPPTEIPTDVILVAPTVRPDWLKWLHQVRGIITEQGGMTSHAAILARELGIPAVVGIAKVTQLLEKGTQIYLDGDRGTVQRTTTAVSEVLKASHPNLDYQTHQGQDLGAIVPAALPSDFVDVAEPRPLKTRLLVNWGQLERAADLAALPVDGVGLIRSEFLLRDCLSRYYRPGMNQDWVVINIAERIREIAAAFFPRPVFYRTLDLRSHEVPWESDRSASELNPTLGMHGALSYQINPTLFDLEMAAIAYLHRAGLTNVQILLPFVRTVEEFTFCRQRLERQTFPSLKTLEVWIMAEVPSVLFLLPAFAEAGVSGISIGSNDLTQLILGVDRDQAEMAIAYDPLHPAILAAMQHLVQTARQLNLPCSICGQAPSQYPELVEQLVSWGISAISVSPDAIAVTRSAIARAEAQSTIPSTNFPF